MGNDVKNTENNIEQIRQLIFGEQLRDCNRKFNESKKQHDNLKKYINAEQP